MTIEEVFENNMKWIAGKLKSDSDYFNKLSAGQAPEFLYTLDALTAG